MSTKVLRKIVRFDEKKCDGCGQCVPACAEGAIQIIHGKAKLIREDFCDGLGACLGECPRDAISIEEREVEPFDEEAVKAHLEEEQPAEEPLPCGCPSSMVQQFKVHEETDCRHAATGDIASSGPTSSMLSHWPVQLALVPPKAPFLQGADLLLAAHCGPFAYGAFHHDFIKGRAVVCACPKLDNAAQHQERLTDLLRQSDIRSLTLVNMEIPCCGGLEYIAREAIRASGKDIPLNVITLGINGEVREPRS